MEGKLIKDHDEYMLINHERFVIATTDTSMLEVTDKIKLSKQNCDEIFGVVDVEKLADELKAGISYKEYDHLIKRGIIVGFNKAMELNKDKVFTLDDIQEAHRLGWDSHKDWVEGKETNVLFLDWIKSKQPTEIEVEIEVTKSDDIKSVEKDWYKIGEPKLDENGCLILKRI